MNELTLHEAFGELIKVRAWYRYGNCPISYKQAQKDAFMFKNNKFVSEIRMRIYLSSIGVERVQEEKWIFNKENFKYNEKFGSLKNRRKKSRNNE